MRFTVLDDAFIERTLIMIMMMLLEGSPTWNSIKYCSLLHGIPDWTTCAVDRMIFGWLTACGGNDFGIFP